jgi:DNA-binding transcriptional MerR regulator
VAAAWSDMQKKLPLSLDIPDKLYFRIGEVSKMVGLAPYVLRFWETEFSKIKPRRTSSGRRLYTQKDIELIKQIKYLLYEKKYTIKGARQHIGRRSGKKGELSQHLIDDLRQELKSIKDLLD